MSTVSAKRACTDFSQTTEKRRTGAVADTVARPRKPPAMPTWNV